MVVNGECLQNSLRRKKTKHYWAYKKIWNEKCYVVTIRKYLNLENLLLYKKKKYKKFLILEGYFLKYKKVPFPEI